MYADHTGICRHQLIAIWKTAYYSFYFPVALAMLFVGIKDEKLFKQTKDILIPLGEYYQVQGMFIFESARINSKPTLVSARRLSRLLWQAGANRKDWYRHYGQQVLLVGHCGAKRRDSGAA